MDPGTPASIPILLYCRIRQTHNGFTFAAKLLEKGEAEAPALYGEAARRLPEAASILADEDLHEEELLEMLDEERLRYASSVVLGLNDALVELTGALAGLTLALRNVQLIALSGLITGIAAAFSMAASEYLSTQAGPPFTPALPTSSPWPCSSCPTYCSMTSTCAWPSPSPWQYGLSPCSTTTSPSPEGRISAGGSWRWPA